MLKEVIKAFNNGIDHFKRERQLRTKLCNTMLCYDFKSTCMLIKRKVNDIKTTARHFQKLLRDTTDLHSKIIQKKRSKNRGFSKTEIAIKKKSKHKSNKINNM